MFLLVCLWFNGSLTCFSDDTLRDFFCLNFWGHRFLCLIVSTTIKIFRTIEVFPSFHIDNIQLTLSNNAFPYLFSALLFFKLIGFLFLFVVFF